MFRAVCETDYAQVGEPLDSLCSNEVFVKDLEVFKQDISAVRDDHFPVSLTCFILCTLHQLEVPGAVSIGQNIELAVQVFNGIEAIDHPGFKDHRFAVRLCSIDDVNFARKG